MVVLMARELSAQLNKECDDIVVNIANPGFCKTENHREFSGFKLVVESLMELVIGRSSDVGGRMLVAGIEAGPESQGAYMSDGLVCR
jgi:retinol dehydrogenase-12